METLYVMRLQNNKWYIGKTKNYNHRMDQHVGEKGAQWTKKHGPAIQCSALGEYMDATWEETKKTLEWMCDKGLNNVRGAEYCRIADYTEQDALSISWAVNHHLNRDQATAYTQLLAGLGSKKVTEKPIPSSQPSGVKRQAEAPSQDDLITHLKELRKTLAAEKRVQLYHIFSNETLEDMAQVKPTHEQDFLSIRGVGQVKFTKYGNAFIACVKSYLRTHCRMCDATIPDNPLKPVCLDCFRKGRYSK